MKQDTTHILFLSQNCTTSFIETVTSNVICMIHELFFYYDVKRIGRYTSFVNIYQKTRIRYPRWTIQDYTQNYPQGELDCLCRKTFSSTAIHQGLNLVRDLKGCLKGRSESIRGKIKDGLHVSV